MAAKKNPSKKMVETLSLPEGVKAEFDNGVMTITGPKGEVKRKLLNPTIAITVKENSITLMGGRQNRRHKKVIGTMLAHMGNMINGVTKPHVYKLKICSGHFPMAVTIAKNEIVIKNFLGEKVPRSASLRQDVSVKLEGETITIESCDKDAAGEVAARIELLTSVRNRDLRVFQDGIYIIEKDGKAVH